MLQRYPVALVGFSAFERNVLGAALRLSDRRHPTYTIVEQPSEARFIVADTDSAGSLEVLQQVGRVADTVFIGAQAPENAPAWMMRPIDATKVLMELDVMAAQDAVPGLTAARSHIESSASRRSPSSAGPSRRASDAVVEEARRRG